MIPIRLHREADGHKQKVLPASLSTILQLWASQRPLFLSRLFQAPLQYKKEQVIHILRCQKYVEEVFFHQPLFWFRPCSPLFPSLWFATLSPRSLSLPSHLGGSWGERGEYHVNFCNSFAFGVEKNALNHCAHCVAILVLISAVRQPSLQQPPSQVCVPAPGCMNSPTLSLLPSLLHAEGWTTPRFKYSTSVLRSPLFNAPFSCRLWGDWQPWFLTVLTNPAAKGTGAKTTAIIYWFVHLIYVRTGL